MTDNRNTSCSSCLRRLISFVGDCPVTIAISFVAVVVSLKPEFASLLELNFGRVADGQLWRLFTGHLTHYNAEHLFWDLAMFCALSAICESRHGGGYWAAIMATCVFISGAVAITCPGVLVYRGLSGLDTGLFAWFAIDQFRRNQRAGDQTGQLLWSLAFVALLGKLGFECFTDSTLFADSEDFVPLVQSHVAGAACGIVMALARILHQPRSVSSRFGEHSANRMVTDR
ncbi:MAG: rhombosortase [Planctomycetota bacterium]